METESSPRENFEFLWQACNERYSFFEYKDVDWNEIHDKYDTLITDDMSEVALFQTLFAMMNELEDGHVNLVSTFNVSRFDLDELGPVSIDWEVIKKDYLGLYNYFQTGPFAHYFLESGKIGYVRYESFASTISNGDLDFILGAYENTQGLIIDLRQNGGGSISNVFRLMERFVDTETDMYDSYLKNGQGSNDFSEPQRATVSPYDGRRYNNPIVLLTDRGSYSATSFFTLAMRELPNVTVIGDSTGGGLGAPGGGQIPNGWTFRLSTTQTISLSGENFENGIPPDIYVPYRKDLALSGIDNILERALLELR